MWFRSVFSSLKLPFADTPARSTGCRPPWRRSAVRLRLEALEDRRLPSFLAPVNYSVGKPCDRGDGRPQRRRQARPHHRQRGRQQRQRAAGQRRRDFPGCEELWRGLLPYSVAVGDFNGDGKLDIVAANFEDSTVSVLLGNGDGTFQAARNYATGSYPVSVAVGNFHGHLDIVTANAGDGTVSLLPGNGDGTFQLGRTVATASGTASLAVGDVNGDGHLDLVIADSGPVDSFGATYGGSVDVLLGNGAGGFQAPISTTLGSGQSPYAIAVGDVNGDGIPDLAVAASVTTYYVDPDSPNYPNGGTLSTNYSLNILLGRNDGTFSVQSTESLGSTSAVLVDLNRDGRPDLVTTDPAGVSVQLGNGDGSFGATQNFAAGSNPLSVAAGDFNGDGFPDLAVANNGFNNVSVLLNAADWSTPSPPSSFGVTGFPSTTTAGAAGTFTVTAKNADGTTDTGYTGTVHFTSTDGQGRRCPPTIPSPPPMPACIPSAPR